MYGVRRCADNRIGDIVIKPTEDQVSAACRTLVEYAIAQEQAYGVHTCNGAVEIVGRQLLNHLTFTVTVQMINSRIVDMTPGAVN